jgi:aspartate/methionine/tyrosine aminotransferase
MPDASRPASPGISSPRLSRRGQVDAFLAMDVLAAADRAAAAGRDVVRMEVGQPATGAPAAARAALAAAMEAGPLGYTGALGLPALRARIARHYADWYGIDLDPARVVVTSGASAGFLLAFTALFDAGEAVGLGLPCYPSYRQILRALSLRDVAFETGPETRWQPAPRNLPEGLSGLIVASPSNPAGTMLDRAALAALHAACADRGVALISDEIYHGLDYGTRAASVLEVADDAYVVNSFSKYFSMTGWRIGWLVVPEDHVRTVERLAQNMFICAPHASQVAALAAMDAGAELDANVARYAANRRLLMDGLGAAGLGRFAPPDGAFYVYADVSHMGRDSRELAADILARADVAVTPGVDFDAARGAGTLRLSYAGATEDVARGLDRLTAYFAA